MATRRRWNDLSPATRGLIIAAGAVQIGLIGLAHADLTRRSDAEVRGSKHFWRLATLVNFVGPIAYFTAGRLPRETGDRAA